jgi:hypothetical protein
MVNPSRTPAASHPGALDDEGEGDDEHERDRHDGKLSDRDMKFDAGDLGPQQHGADALRVRNRLAALNRKPQCLLDDRRE